MKISELHIYIGRQALVETPIILSATRFAGFSTAGWLPGFPAAFFNASPTAFIAGASTSASSFVDSPTYLCLGLDALMDK